MYASSRKQLPEVFCKKDVLETWEISHENICVGVFFNKITTWKPVTLLKKTPTQVFSCEIFGNFKNTYFEEYLPATAPERLRKIIPLLVLGRPLLDGKRNNRATNFLIENMNLWS